METQNAESSKSKYLAGSALDHLKQFAHEHPEAESAGIAALSLAVGYMAHRFHLTGAAERFLPKASVLLGETAETLLNSHAAIERLPKFTGQL